MRLFLSFCLLSLLLLACSEPKGYPSNRLFPVDMDTFVNRKQVEADWNLQKDESYISYSDTFEEMLDFFAPRQKTRVTDINLSRVEEIQQERINSLGRQYNDGLIDAFELSAYSNTKIIQYPPARLRCWVDIEWAWLLKDTFQYTVTDSLDKLVSICTCNNPEVNTLPKNWEDRDYWECNFPTEKLQYYDPIMVVKKFHLASRGGKTQVISLKNSAKFKLFKDILDKSKIYQRKKLYGLLSKLNNPTQPNPQLRYNSYNIIFDTLTNYEMRRFLNNSIQTNGTLLYKYTRSKYISLDYNGVAQLKAWSPCQKEPLEYKEIALYAWVRKPTFIYFKKYHNGSPNEWYYYFVFYYFDFDKDNIAQLADIELVMPPKFGLHLHGTYMGH